MVTVDLDPLVRQRRKELANGVAQQHDRFLLRLEYGQDRVRWTGPDGVVNEQEVKTNLFEYTPLVLGRL